MENASTRQWTRTVFGMLVIFFRLARDLRVCADGVGAGARK
jgi:hypothetical protein